jgi:hypothetical protein
LRPKPETINVEKQHVFDIDFSRVRPYFGSVFGRFFGSKMHANSETKKSVRQAKNTVKTNAKLTLALVQQNIYRTKICEKSHVFWDIDFGRLLGGFWKGLGGPNP